MLKPKAEVKPVVIAASDAESMAKFAKPGVSSHDVLHLISKWSFDYKNGKKYGLEALKSVTSHAFNEITRHAFEDDDKAAEDMFGFLSSHVHDFDELCHLPERHAFFEHIAETHTTWPGMLSCDLDIIRRNQKLIKSLKLGSKYGLNYSGRQWTRDTPETFAALKLWGIVREYRQMWLDRHKHRRQIRRTYERLNQRIGRPKDFRPAPIKRDYPPKLAKEFERRGQSQRLARKLAPLSRDNYKEWYEAALPEFINFYGEDFENRKAFSDYWKNAAYKDQKDKRALIRRDIKKKLKQAFRSIAPRATPL